MTNDLKGDLFEARIKIGNNIIFKTSGNDPEELKIIIATHCESESSGVEGEIVEVSTKNVIYRCRKQTLVDD